MFPNQRVRSYTHVHNAVFPSEFHLGCHSPVITGGPKSPEGCHTFPSESLRGSNVYNYAVCMLVHGTLACCLMHANGSCACPDPLYLACAGAGVFFLPAASTNSLPVNVVLIEW